MAIFPSAWLRGCRWWSIRASAATLSVSKSAFSSHHLITNKPALFRSHPRLPKRQRSRKAEKLRCFSWNCTILSIPDILRSGISPVDIHFAQSSTISCKGHTCCCNIHKLQMVRWSRNISALWPSVTRRYCVETNEDAAICTSGYPADS